MGMFKRGYGGGRGLRALGGAVVAAFLVGTVPAIAAPGGLSVTGQGQPIVNDLAVSTGYLQVASFAVSTGFTPPTGSQWCIVVPSAAVRYRADGVAPTASVGMPVAANAGITFRLTNAGLVALRFIPQTGSAVLDVDCYKDY